ncbi:MAG: hypothetical protein AAGA99_25365 [Actinomycetota bacterium]
MTTPLSTLLVELFTDPDGRAALGEDPAATLEAHGWSDLSPDDLADAVRLVTAGGPAAAAQAGADVPDEPGSHAEALDGVLRAVEGVETWAPEPTAPIEAGSIEPASFDFEPAPLSGTALIGDDVPDDPFLAEDGADAPVDAEVPEAEPTTEDSGDAIDLTFDETEATDVEAEPTTEDAAADDAAMEESFDGLELELPDTSVSLDELEPQDDGGMVDLDENDPELPGSAWGDLDDDLE